MSDLGSERHPLRRFTRADALRHWRTGNGGDVYVDMRTHMVSGGGRALRVESLAPDIRKSVVGMPVGSTIRFESNEDQRDKTGAAEATSKHSYYGPSIGKLASDDAFIRGQTSAGFRGDATVLPGGVVGLNGELRPFQEGFDFDPNWNPLMALPKLYGRMKIGGGTPTRSSLSAGDDRSRAVTNSFVRCRKANRFASGGSGQRRSRVLVRRASRRRPARAGGGALFPKAAPGTQDRRRRNAH